MQSKFQDHMFLQIYVVLERNGVKYSTDLYPYSIG